jgi:hypothetical protein
MELGRRDRIVAAVACVIVPLTTFAFDRGSVGYTMYAGATLFQVEIAVTRAGSPERVSCAQAATVLSGSAGTFLAGADMPRPARSTVALRAHFDAVARAACLVTRADAATVTLHEWRDGGDPIETTFEAPCR